MMRPLSGSTMPYIPRTYRLQDPDYPATDSDRIDVIAWVRRETGDDFRWLYLTGIPGLGKSVALSRLEADLTAHGVHAFHFRLDNRQSVSPGQILNDLVLEWAKKLDAAYPGLKRKVTRRNSWSANIDALRNHIGRGAPAYFCLLLDGLETSPPALQEAVCNEFYPKYLAGDVEELYFTAIVAYRNRPKRGRIPWVEGEITLEPLVGEARNEFVAQFSEWFYSLLSSPAGEDARVFQTFQGLDEMLPKDGIDQLRALPAPQARDIGQSIDGHLTGIPSIDVLLLVCAWSCHPRPLTQADRDACGQAYLRPIWPEVVELWPYFLELIRQAEFSKAAFSSAGIGLDNHPLQRAAIIRDSSIPHYHYRFDPGFHRLFSAADAA